MREKQRFTTPQEKSFLASVAPVSVRWRSFLMSTQECPWHFCTEMEVRGWGGGKGKSPLSTGRACWNWTFGSLSIKSVHRQAWECLFTWKIFWSWLLSIRAASAPLGGGARWLHFKSNQTLKDGTRKQKNSPTTPPDNEKNNTEFPGWEKFERPFYQFEVYNHLKVIFQTLDFSNTWQSAFQEKLLIFFTCLLRPLFCTGFLRLVVVFDSTKTQEHYGHSLY